MEQQRETESVMYFSLSLTLCRILLLFCITLTCTVLVCSDCYLTSVWLFSTLHNSLFELSSIFAIVYLGCIAFLSDIS